MQVKEVMIRFDRFYHDTGRAILVGIAGSEHWLPKKMCRNIVINKKLGGNVRIPTWLCDEKGIQWSDEDGTFSIHHHVPEKKNATKIDPDESLTR